MDIISQIEESDNSIEEEETLNDLIDQFNSNDSNNDKSNESNSNENIQHQIEQNFHNLYDKIDTDIITPYELKRFKKIKKNQLMLENLNLKPIKELKNNSNKEKKLKSLTKKLDIQHI